MYRPAAFAMPSVRPCWLLQCNARENSTIFFIQMKTCAHSEGFLRTLCRSPQHSWRGCLFILSQNFQLSRCHAHVTWGAKALGTAGSALTCAAVQEGHSISVNQPLRQHCRASALLGCAATVRVPPLCSSLPARLLPALTPVLLSLTVRQR